MTRRQLLCITCAVVTIVSTVLLTVTATRCLAKSLLKPREHTLAKPLLIMVNLWNRADHYIFPYGFFFFYLSFFPRLISDVADWMSVILPHMV